MYKWKNNNGEEIYWFDIKNYRINKEKGRSFFYKTFSSYIILNRLYPDGYIIPGDTNLSSYFNNFVSNLQEKSVLYFDKSSNFPKQKISLINYKRTTNLCKANTIVLNKADIFSITDKCYIFTNGIDYFGITENDFNLYFDGNWEKLKDKKTVGFDFQKKLNLIYYGTLKIIVDEFDTIKNFYSNKYTKNFISDYDLNKIINNVLPDPKLKELLSIKQMLDSSDGATIKLGILMTCGYNITKWPLTFRILLGHNPYWYDYNKKIKEVQLIWKALKLKNKVGGIYNVATLIDALDEDYSKEDIKLAKDLAKTLPDIIGFCEMNQKYYLDTLPFIPNEYKK